MAVSTTFRTNLAAFIQNALITAAVVQDTFELVPGMLEGPQNDKDRGGIWVDAIEEDANGVDVELIYVHVRVFKRFYERRSGDVNPYDPTDLEAVAEAVQTMFNAPGVQTGQGIWYFRVQRIDFLLDTQGLEASIVGRNANLYQTTS